jgi:hypothetical protein
LIDISRSIFLMDPWFFISIDEFIRVVNHNLK